MRELFSSARRPGRPPRPRGRSRSSPLSRQRRRACPYLRALPLQPATNWTCSLTSSELVIASPTRRDNVWVVQTRRTGMRHGTVMVGRVKGADDPSAEWRHVWAARMTKSAPGRAKGETKAW